MVAYTKPQQRKNEEIKRLRGERDQIKRLDLRFERWQAELCTSLQNFPIKWNLKSHE